VIAHVICRFASVLALARRPEDAVRVLSSSAALHEKIGAMPPYVAKLSTQTLEGVRPQLDEVAFADAWEQGRRMTADEAVALALDALS
jgi:hypothetical protein